MEDCYIEEMRKKIIMLLANEFNPDPRVHQEAKSLVKNGFKVTIIAWDREVKWQKFETIDGIKVERSHIKSFYRRGTSQFLFLFLFWIDTIQRVIRKDFDFIHCHDFNTLPIGFILGKLRRKKIIFDAHESYSDMLGDNVSVSIKKVIFIIEKILIRHVDLLITVGEILKNEYEKRGAKKTCVVGNWKDSREFQVSQKELLEEQRRLKIPKDRLIILFKGLLNKDRVIFPLIEAVKRTPELFLLLAGKGELESRIKSEIKNSSNIIFLGEYSQQEIPLYTLLCDVVYYVIEPKNPNGKYSAPNSLFEVLVCGKAIMTGNQGEIAKIVREESCGVILNDISPEKIAKIFNTFRDDRLLDNYKMNALSAAREKYNWERGEKILLDTYSKIN